MNNQHMPAVRAAKRLIGEYMKVAVQGEDCDSHFDGGEWSGPAHARLQQEEEERILEQVAKRFSIQPSELAKAYDEDMRWYCH